MRLTWMVLRGTGAADIGLKIRRSRRLSFDAWPASGIVDLSYLRNAGMFASFDDWISGMTADMKVVAERNTRLLSLFSFLARVQG